LGSACAIGPFSGCLQSEGTDSFADIGGAEFSFKMVIKKRSDYRSRRTRVGVWLAISPFRIRKK
jgi:hypothetical protein